MKQTRISFERAEGFDRKLIEKASTSLLPEDDDDTNAEFMRAVRLALRGVFECDLTERQKQIFIMYCIEGMKSPAIAEKLGITTQAVTKSLRASRKKIADRLKYCF